MLWINVEYKLDSDTVLCVFVYHIVLKTTFDGLICFLYELLSR